MKTDYTLLLTFFFASLLNAQNIDDGNRDNIWLFGYDSFTQPGFGGTVIDFNLNAPNIYHENREMAFSQTAASICDTDGNLLFYTNGIYLANALGNQMENGGNLNPGIWTTSWEEAGLPVSQGLIILPVPEHEHQYMLIHGLLDIPPGLGPIYSHLYYSTIDMQLDNGFGALVDKNVEIIKDTLLRGKITAVRHGNGRDWWIVIPEHDTNRYYRMMLTPNGINGIDVQSVGDSVVQGVAQAVFTPDGSKYIRYDGVSLDEGDYLNVYDFDRCTGLLSNQLELHLIDSSAANGLSVSRNSRFAYVAAGKHVFQYDLWAIDMASSLDTVAVYDGFVSLGHHYTTFYLSQLAPDGKIYVNTPSGSDVLHVIHEPNKKGGSCRMEQHGVQLAARNAFTMPNFPNFRLGPLDGSPCDTLGIDNVPVAKYRYEQPDSSDYRTVAFRDLSYYEPAEWYWDFGDGTTSQDTSPVHNYLQDGTYEVCLTVSNMNGEGTFCRTLFLGTVATQEAPPAVDVNIFPNPCREGVNVVIDGYLPREAKVVLYNAVGQLHKVERLQVGWNTVRLEGLQAGIYFYEIFEGDVKLKGGKLVKL